ncbi:MAG: hypothetical protein AAB250_01495 [Bdellovibrionota bacterium]
MMKIKMIVFLAISGILASALLVYVLTDETPTADENPREVASAPGDYKSMAACDKQDFLWRNIKATEYKTLPAFKPMGPYELWSMNRQELSLKGSHYSDIAPNGWKNLDIAPNGWKKYLHARGAVAKVKIVSRGTGLTGIFRGADCALLRLSITFKPGFGKGFAPGLALKVLRDRVNSANVSALVSLAGQGKDYNFFRHPLSNIVPAGGGLTKIVHYIFKKVTSYPEELVVADMATFDSRGDKATEIVTPRQLFFVPGPGLAGAKDAHDVRLDYLEIPADTVIYRVLAVPASKKNFNYANYTDASVKEFLNESQHVADIVTTSEFVASAFGDDALFFRHQIRP